MSVRDSRQIQPGFRLAAADIALIHAVGQHLKGQRGHSMREAAETLSLVEMDAPEHEDYGSESRWVRVTTPATQEDDAMRAEAVRQVIDAIVFCLTDRERDVLIRHTVHDETLDRIGESYGISKEAVRRTHKRAVNAICARLGISPPPSRGNHRTWCSRCGGRLRRKGRQMYCPDCTKQARIRHYEKRKKEGR